MALRNLLLPFSPGMEIARGDARQEEGAGRRDQMCDEVFFLSRVFDAAGDSCGLSTLTVPSTHARARGTPHTHSVDTRLCVTVTSAPLPRRDARSRGPQTGTRALLLCPKNAPPPLANGVKARAVCVFARGHPPLLSLRPGRP